MPLAPIDRLAVTTVVDNSVDILRPDEKVARRWGVPRARKIADLRAEHGLAHYVEVTRGRETGAIGFDFGLTEASMTHNFRELGLDAGKIDALALSHGHSDHFGGLLGFLSAYRRQMQPGIPIITWRAGWSAKGTGYRLAASIATTSPAGASTWSTSPSP